MKSFDNFSYGKYLPLQHAESMLQQAPAQTSGQGINKTGKKDFKWLKFYH